MPRALTLVLYAVIGFGLLAALAIYGQRHPSQEQLARRERIAALNAHTVAKRDELVKQAVKDGVVRKVTCTGNEAQVPLSTWIDADADAKKAMTILLAAWCEDQQSGNRITIIDAQSGRTLATYDGVTYSVR